MPIDAAELRTLFLFQDLTEDQLAWVAERAEAVVYPAGARVYTEGEPAAWFFVLLEGGLRLTRMVGQEEVTVNETTQRGVYSGAIRAWVASEEHYSTGVVTLRESRFLRLAAADVNTLMRTWYPMAVHLLDGLFLGMRNTEAAVRQQEKLAALGSLSAGLSHELNNPAAAGVRAAGQLRQRIAHMRSKLAAIADGHVSKGQMVRLVALQEEVIARAAKAESMTAVEESDREDELADWLDEHGVSHGWELAPVFAQGGLDTAWLDGVAETMAPGVSGSQAGSFLEGSMRWLFYTLETENLIDELEEATRRISALVGAVKTYSHMDQAAFSDVDVKSGVKSTLVLMSHRAAGIRLETHWQTPLPKVPGYAGELNQVWTNLVDNALAAARTTVTVTVRGCDGGPFGGGVEVQIADDGPGIPDDVLPRVWERFFSTKPAGEGSGLGLDVARRIVEDRHHGQITLDTAPTGTTLTVRLPGGHPGQPIAAG